MDIPEYITPCSATKAGGKMEEGGTFTITVFVFGSWPIAVLFAIHIKDLMYSSFLVCSYFNHGWKFYHLFFCLVPNGENADNGIL